MLAFILVLCLTAGVSAQSQCTLITAKKPCVANDCEWCASIHRCAIPGTCPGGVRTATKSQRPVVLKTQRPVVLMHGLMATAPAMSHAQGWIEADYPGIYVKNVEIGKGKSKFDSLLIDINKQVSDFAKQVKNDTKLTHGFNLIGHSQGALIARAYIHRFNDPPVYNFISWAGPHAGVYGVPWFNALCPDVACPWLVEAMDDLVRPKGIATIAESLVSFAAYWRSPVNYTAYVSNNVFLADINNEGPTKKASYKQNFVSLNHVALLHAAKDLIVVPSKSEWFSFYDTVKGTDGIVVPFSEQPMYKEDWIGLRTLDEAKKITRWSVPCAHQDVPRADCKSFAYDNVTKALLNNFLP